MEMVQEASQRTDGWQGFKVTVVQRKNTQRPSSPAGAPRIAGDRWYFDPPDRHFDIVEARIAFDAAPVAIVLCSLAGQLVQANRAFQAMVGLQSLPAFDHADVATICAAHFELDFIEGLARDGVMRRLELQDRVSQDGSGTVMCTASRIDGEEGMPRWLLVVFDSLLGVSASPSAAVDPRDEWSASEELAQSGYWCLHADAQPGMTSGEMNWSSGMFNLLDVKPTPAPRTVKQWLATVARHDRAAVAAALRDLTARGGEYDIEYSRLAHDAGPVTIRSRARSVGPISASGVYAVAGVEQRVDTSVHAHDRIASVMQAIIDSSDCPVFAVDCHWCVTWSNGAFRTMLGSRHTGAGTSLVDYALLVPDACRWQQVFESLRRALRGERRIEETLVHGVNGRARWYDLTYNPVLNAEGKVTGVAVSGIDVSARRIADDREQLPADPALQATSMPLAGA